MTEQEFMERMKRAKGKVKDGILTPIVDMLSEDRELAITANIDDVSIRRQSHDQE